MRTRPPQTTRNLKTRNRSLSRDLCVTLGVLALALAADARSARAENAAEDGGSVEARSAELDELRGLLDRLEERLEKEQQEAEGKEAERKEAELQEAERQRATARAEQERTSLPAEAEATALRARIATLEAEIESARNEAQRALRVAREAKLEAEAGAEAYRKRYARKGAYLGAAYLYAPQDFETRGDASSARGFAGYVGYRVHRNVALEVRYERFDDFGIDFSEVVAGVPNDSLILDGDIDAFAVTANAKLYPFTGSLQPYIGLGLGALDATMRGQTVAGDPVRRNETSLAVRPALGLDLHLSENLVLSVEAAYLAPSAELGSLRFGSLSSGISFRF